MPSPHHSDVLADMLMSWINIDSVTSGEANYLEAIEALLESRGFDCLRQDIEENRWNLLATKTANPKVLLSTHVDTVPPFIGARREGDVIYGRGACDTKGGLVAMIEAAWRLQDESWADEIGFLLVVGEEVNHIGAIHAPELKLMPERIILCEPTVNKVVAAQKGMIKLKVCAHGTAAHSAYPDRGDSALHRMVDAMHGLLHTQWPEDAQLGSTTLNIGMLNAGVAHNVFAPRADASVLIRTVRPTTEYVETIKATTTPHRVDAPIEVDNDPVFFDPPDDVETCNVSFNTDASYLEPMAPIWLVGPGDIEVAHTDHEHIHMTELMRGVELYMSLIREVLDQDEEA